MADLVELFVSIGLNEQKAKETLKNEQLTAFLKQVIHEVGRVIVVVLKGWTSSVLVRRASVACGTRLLHSWCNLNIVTIGLCTQFMVLVRLKKKKKSHRSVVASFRICASVGICLRKQITDFFTNLRLITNFQKECESEYFTVRSSN